MAGPVGRKVYETDPSRRRMPSSTKKPGRISKAGVGAKLKAGVAKAGRAGEKFSSIVESVVSPLPGKGLKGRAVKGAAKLGYKALPTGVTMRMRSLGTELDLRKIAMERLQREERAQVAMRLLKRVPQTRRR